MMDKKEAGIVLGDEILEIIFAVEKAQAVNESIQAIDFFTSDEKKAIENIRKTDYLVAVVEDYEKYCNFYQRTGLTKKAFFAEMEAKGFRVKIKDGSRIYKNYAVSTWKIDNSDLEPYS